MKDLAPILETPNSFTLFLAPTGWGKTSLLLDFYQQNNRRIIYFSPLRALAEEFAKRLKTITSPLFPQKISEFSKEMEKFLKSKKAFMVVTPEVFNIQYLECLKKDDLIVLDEIHLFFYWGQSFRPYLWEFLLSLSLTGTPIFALTATMDQRLIEEWKKNFILNHQQLFLLDLGNLILSKNIKEIYYYPTYFKKLFNRQFLKSLLSKEKETLIYFCQFRYEVQKWLDFCERQNINALGCVGGGASDFIKDLNKNPHPKCIFCTSTLSHGVNLPSPSQIFINYKVKQKDFWVQMVGRGGRDGRKFNLHTFNKYEISFRHIIYQFLKNILVL